MPHCPDCGEDIEDFDDVEETWYNEDASIGDPNTAMYSCPGCGAVLGFSGHYG